MSKIYDCFKNDLKSCPICGEAVEYWPESDYTCHMIVCAECCLSIEDDSKTYKELRDTWNTIPRNKS